MIGLEFRHSSICLDMEYMGFGPPRSTPYGEPNSDVQAKQFQENFGIRSVQKPPGGFN